MPFWLQKSSVASAPPPKYEALRNGSSEDIQDKESLFTSPPSEHSDPKGSHYHISVSKRALILTSSVFAVMAVILIAVLSSRSVKKPWPVPEFGHTQKVLEPMYDWEYGPHSADLWNSVLGYKGFVLIENGAQYGLGDGMPSVVEGAGVYGISATHQFHCLNMIRNAFMGLTTQDPQYVKEYWVSPTFSSRPASKPGHIFHCLDYLRQMVMCNADTTIEWRSEQDPLHIDGYGPPHQCKDWAKVVQWLGDNMPPDERFHPHVA